MKSMVWMGVVLGLVGCSGAGDTEAEWAAEPVGEASDAVLGYTSYPLISPFADNTTYHLTQVQLDGQIRTVGFMFASPGTSPGVDQEQRWVLFAGYSLPLGTVGFEIPGPARRYTSLDAWKAGVTSGESPLWRSGATYVKVQTSNEPFGSPQGTEFCNLVTCSYYPQLIDKAGIMYRLGIDGKYVLQGVAKGGPLEYVKGATDQMTNTEVWWSKPDYVAALSDTVPSFALNVHQYIDLGMALATFGEGSTKTTATCTYFTNLPQNL